AVSASPQPPPSSPCISSHICTAVRSRPSSNPFSRGTNHEGEPILLRSFRTTLTSPPFDHTAAARKAQNVLVLYTSVQYTDLYMEESTLRRRGGARQTRAADGRRGGKA